MVGNTSQENTQRLAHNIRDRPRGAFSMYWRFALTSIQAQMQYKMSFFLSTLGQFLATGIEVAGVWALFTRFGSLQNWRLEEVCLFYGVVNVAFAISDALATGFDRFGTAYIRTGGFDRILVRPRGIVLQLLGHELALRRVGRLIQGLLVLSWALVALEADINALGVVYVVLVIACGACLFLGLFVFQATLSFWSVESLEIMNAMTYGGVQTAQYPISIYEEWFRSFFIFIVPVASIAYFPLLIVLGKVDPLGSPYFVQLISPIAGIVFLGVAIAVFRFVGVRHYASTGS